MGFNASAKLFYGMPINKNEHLRYFSDYNDECKIEKETGCHIVYAGSHEYYELAIAFTMFSQSHDWNDGGFSLLNKDIKSHISLNPEIWREHIEKACKAYSVTYNESKCGWYICSFYG